MCSENTAAGKLKKDLQSWTNIKSLRGAKNISA
jgi:hypothetical protein